MKIKKGTDVYEVTIEGGEYPFLLNVNCKRGKKLTEALEDIMGCPALDDYGAERNKDNYLTIHRYRTEKDLKLVDE